MVAEGHPGRDRWKPTQIELGESSQDKDFYPWPVKTQLAAASVRGMPLSGQGPATVHRCRGEAEDRNDFLKLHSRWKVARLVLSH